MVNVLYFILLSKEGKVSDDNMTGRIVLITGANSGIGLATANHLAALGAEVLLVCRDVSRGQSALRTVTSVAKSAQPKLLLADLSQQTSIRRLAQDVRTAVERVDVLINNAGAVFSQRELTPDGIEKTFATNHLASFLLTGLLMSHLRRSKSARIVNVASRVHANALDFDNLQCERAYSAMKAYRQSKLENILFTYELARRLGTGISANCLAPGLVASNFGHNAGGLISLMPKVLAMVGLAISPEDGAKTSIFLASDPAVEGVSGRYFYKCQETQSKPVSYRDEVARQLWKVSARMVHQVGWESAFGA